MADVLVSYLKSKINNILRFKNIRKSYYSLFSDRKNPHVKNVLLDLKTRFGFYDVKTPTENKSRDFYEGQRSVVLHILTMSKPDMNDDIEDIEEMLKIINNE